MDAGGIVMFEKTDLDMCSNVVAALKRGQFTLSGEEALAFTQTIKWLVELYKKIEVSINDTPLNHNNIINDQKESSSGNNVQPRQGRRTK